MDEVQQSMARLRAQYGAKRPAFGYNEEAKNIAERAQGVLIGMLVIAAIILVLAALHVYNGVRAIMYGNEGGIFGDALMDLGWQAVAWGSVYIGAVALLLWMQVKVSARLDQQRPAGLLTALGLGWFMFAMLGSYFQIKGLLQGFDVLSLVALLAFLAAATAAIYLVFAANQLRRANSS